MNRLEDAIRDYLADHLELLELGLRLVKKEFRLPNDQGAGGRIDIVAKDRFEHYVVIEIKRSNQAARQALNEIHKYTALFRRNLGLDQKKVRLMVVSTEWHELHLALSEYAGVTPYSVEGYEIEADAVGVVSNARKVKLDATQVGFGDLKLSRCQGMYLFREAAKRDAFFNVLSEALGRAGINDFALLECDYQGGSSAIIYPRAAYLCFVSPLEGAGHESAEEIKSRFDWEELDQPDENFLCAIEQERTFEVDDFEIGYPEKLSNAESSGWRIKVARRGGRLSSGASIISDEEIVKLAQATGGGSHFYYGGSSSPRFEASWNTFRSNIFPVLQGYPAWEKTMPRVLDEIGKNEPNAVVSISVYGPANLLVSLYAISLAADYSRCPHFELVVEDPDSTDVRIVMGVLVWDGVELDQSTDHFEEVFGDLFEWTIVSSMGEGAAYEAKALKAHNLKVVSAEWRFSEGIESGPHELDLKKSEFVRHQPEEWPYKPLREFTQTHRAYLHRLRERVEEFSIGLRESILGGGSESYFSAQANRENPLCE